MRKVPHFFEKKTKFSLNSTRFLGSKVALSSRKNPLNFFGVSIYLHSPQIFCGLFRKRKLPLSTPKNESNLTRNRDIFEKMWFFPHPGDCNSPFGAATLGISQLAQKNCSPRMRQMPHFLTKIPVSRQIRLVFWGRNWQFFPISGHSCRTLRRPPYVSFPKPIPEQNDD